MQQRTVFTLFHNRNAVRVSFHGPANVRGESVVAWADVIKIEAFKRDLLSVELVCLSLILRDNKTLELNEEMDGWQDLVNKLPEYLQGCQTFAEWSPVVAYPPFKPNRTLIYSRDK
jgi:hypothetical protein